MSIFDSWSEYIIEIIDKESQLASSMLRHGEEIGDAREAIIKGVLARILPSIYEIGTGEIIDHLGHHSKQIDIVIYRRDFPSLLLPSDSRLFLIESVLATIEVKSKLSKKTLIESLDNCASVANLNPNIVAGTLDKLAKERGLTKLVPGNYRHDNPLETGRFDLLGRPVSYVFGFRGYKKSIKKFYDAIEEWGICQENMGNFSMRHIPAVIVAEGLYGWRNAVPYAFDNNILCLIGRDPNPLRLLVLHLLYTLHRKIPSLPDADGIKPNLDIYLQQMQPPNFELGIFKAINK